MALAGLLLIAYSYYLFYSQSSEIQKEIYSTSLYSKEILVRANHAEKAVSQLELLIDNSISSNKNERIADLEKLTIYYSSNEVKVLYEDLKKMALELELDEARYTHTVQKLTELTDGLSRYRWFLIIFTAIGTALSSYGFQLWYKRVQKYQDEIIQHEYKKLKNQ